MKLHSMRFLLAIALILLVMVFIAQSCQITVVKVYQMQVPATEQDVPQDEDGTILPDPMCSPNDPLCHKTHLSQDI